MKMSNPDIYEAVKADIRRILAGPGIELDRIEACFMSALSHWEQFKQAALGNSFTSRQEEIHFFKFTKPRFTGLVEYYTQRYQALLFVPSGNSAKAHYFWKMEERRIDRFFSRHRDFIRYYQRGDTDLDELYFLREFGDGTNLQCARVYDLDEQISSSHDWIVSRMIALDKYRGNVGDAIYRIEHPMQVDPRPGRISLP